MTRILGHYVSLELCFLWLLETLLCFVIAYTLLVAGIAGEAGRAGIDGRAVANAATLALTTGLISLPTNLYRPEFFLQTRRLVLDTVVAGVLAFPAVLLVGLLVGIEISVPLGRSPLWPIHLLLAWILLLVATRLLFKIAMQLDLFARNVVIVGAANGPDESGRQAAQAVCSLHRGFFAVAGVVPAGEDAAQLRPQVLQRRKIWGIIVTSAADGSVNGAGLPIQALLRCKCAGIRIFRDVDFREQQMRRVDLDRLAPNWLLFAEGLESSRTIAAIRRVADIAISVTLLVGTLPLMLLTALLIKLHSPGPVFYRQERLGLYGRPFIMLKFRSMRIDAEQRGPAWAAQKDPRVTRIGSIIRRIRIDELPQLINVLRGEMSLIGPRPERRHFVEQLTAAIPFYRERACVKPGLTG
jgi:lipopolysaccharide/colanic/teichoic acid biosynthesis glycosyltransferase